MNLCTPSSIPDPSDPLMGLLMQKYWAGHTATIEATTRCAAHLGSFSEKEKDFALSWSNLVKFLGPTRFDVNYTETTALQDILPWRMLRSDDSPGHISDMSTATNRG